MAVLTYSALTPTNDGAPKFNGVSSLSAGQSVAWKIPAACVNFAFVRVRVPSAGTFTVGTSVSGESAYAAGTQVVLDELGTMSDSYSAEFAPCGIIVVTCASGAVVAELEAK